MKNSIHELYRNEGIPVQRRYRRLMGQDLLTKSIERGYLNDYEITASYVFSYFGIPLKYSEIDVPDLESHENPYRVLSNYFRDHECIVKHETFSSADLSLSNGQLLILFDADNNTPFVLTNPTGFGPRLFDPKSCKTLKLHDLNRYRFNTDSLNITYTDVFNKQNFFDLFSFASSHLAPNFLLLGISLVVASVLGLFYPIILSSLISTVIPQGLVDQLIPLSLLFFAITSGFVISQFASIYMFIYADAVVDSRLQVSVFKRLFEMPISFFQSYRSGDLMARAQAITQIRGVLSGSFIDTLVHGSVIITSLIVMTIFSWKLTLFTLVISLLYALSTTYLGLLESKSKIAELRSLGLNIGYIFNTLKSYIQQKAENREKLLSNHFGSLVFQQLKPSFRAEMFSQYADLVDIFLKSFGLFGLFILGHHLSTLTNKSGVAELNTGKFVAYISLYTAYIASLYKLTRSVSKNGSTIFALWKRAEPIFNASSERLDNEFPLIGDIYSVRFSNVTFTYPSQNIPLFSNFSFNVEAGSTVAIKGDTSSGKTTLLNLLIGFDYADSGSIEINNIDIRNLDLFDLRQKFGIIPQSRQILPGFLKDYLLNGGQFYEEEVLDILEQLNYLDEFKKYPLGLNTPLAYGAYNFPSNFREILLITRSLLAKPQIFYADDSLFTSSPETIHNIRKLLGPQAIIFISSSRPDLLNLCDNQIEI